MIQENKYFRISYDGLTWKKSSELSDGIDVLNVKMESGLYSESLTGSRSVIETSIASNSTPYFYGIKKDPLSFATTFAIVSEETTDIVISEISAALIRNEYIKIQFYDNEEELISPLITYDVIATGECKLDYLSQINSNKIMAFLSITFRCASHTGYRSVNQSLSFTEESGIITVIGNEEVINPGFEAVYPSLEMQVNEGYIKIYLSEDEENFFSVYSSGIQTINVDMSTRTITNSNGSNIYANWGKYFGESINRQYLYLNSGTNTIRVKTKTETGIENTELVLSSINIKFNAPCIT